MTSMTNRIRGSGRRIRFAGWASRPTWFLLPKIMATALRTSLAVNTCWYFLEPPVRAYYARRICLIGAESTGKTTLARALAEHYQTVWVPEYGREYSER